MDAPLAAAAARSPRAIRWTRCTMRCAATRRRWRCVASPWPSWATGTRPRPAARGPRVPPGAGAGAGARELAEADVALAMRDRTGPTKRWNPPARPCCGTATSPTPRMPGCCMRGACCCWAVPTTPPSPSRAGIRRRCPPPRGRCMPWPPPASRCAACRQNPPGWRWPRPPRANPVSARCKPRPMRCRACWRPRRPADPPRRAAPAALDEVEALMARTRWWRTPPARRCAVPWPRWTCRGGRCCSRWRASWPRARRRAARGADRRLPPAAARRDPSRPAAGGGRPAARRAQGPGRGPGQPPGYALALPPGCEAVTLARPTKAPTRNCKPCWRTASPGPAPRWPGAGRQPTFGAACPGNPGRRRPAQPAGTARAAPPPPGCATVLLLRRCRRRTSMAPFPSGDSPP